MTAFSLLKRGRSGSPSKRKTEEADRNFCRSLGIAVARHELPQSAADRLKTFLSHGCLPLPAKVDEALDTLQEATKKVKLLDISNKVMTRRAKRYDDVLKGIRSIRRLVSALRNFGIDPQLDSGGSSHSEKVEKCISMPAFISVDLGLRQRRKHMHGALLYQAVMISDSYFSQIRSGVEHNDGCMKIAEGGRYDDLVRHFRPPGNFGSAQFNHYSAAPIPHVSVCVCVCDCIYVSVTSYYIAMILFLCLKNYASK